VLVPAWGGSCPGLRGHGRCCNLYDEALEVLYFGVRGDLRESTVQNIESSSVRCINQLGYGS
jgi:hypothetical protein